jgi:GcrA cell cycle regulator
MTREDISDKGGGIPHARRCERYCAMSLTYSDNQRHNAFHTPWSAERDEALRQLWAQGYSASLIADKLANGSKLTRCAVIGRAHRLKLPARKDQKPLQRKPRLRANGKPRRPQPKPSPPPQPSRLRPVAPVPSPPTEPPAMRKLPLLELEPHHCRWPLGELMEVAHLFCAADTREGEVYCPHHTWMARPRGKQ